MRRFVDWLTTEHWLIGAGLMRISLGTWAVFFYVLHWRFRMYLWGPSGVLPFEKFLEARDTLNVFQLNGSGTYFDAVYIGAIAIAILVTVGLMPRLMIPLHWLMIWSFQERNQFLNDGGDNIMRIVLVFLALMNTGSYFSMQAQGRTERTSSTLARRWATFHEFLRPSIAVVHNIGALLIIAQLCMLYMSTGLYKVMGELWQNGTALYYILRVDEFSWPGVAELIYRNPYLVVIGTYATVLFEVMFVPLLVNRWTRYLMIAAGVFFHLGIALVMGLVTFGWSMLSIYPLLLTDGEYRGAAAWVHRRVRLTALYDADCAFCTRVVRLLAAADLFSLVEYVPYQRPGVLTRYGIPLAKAARRMQSVSSGGRVSEGIDAMVQICMRTAGLWPLLPVVGIGRCVFGHRPYDFVAARRYRFGPGRCPVSTTRE